MIIGGNFSRNRAATSIEDIIELPIHGKWYQWCIEAATIAVLCEIAITDLRAFRILNSRVLLLLLLYVLFAAISRSPSEILWDIVLAVVMFGFLFLLYLKGVVGGGDVKLVPVVCLWVGTHFALPFSLFLLIFTSLHLFACRMGWAPTLVIRKKRAISYAPSIAAALICTIVLASF